MVTTDEPTLGFGKYEAELAIHVFGPFSQLDESYLLWSMNPATDEHMVVKLD